MDGKWLPLSILITGVIYIFYIPPEPIAIKLFFKIIPMVLIIFYAYLNKNRNNEHERFHWIMMTGLFFCMLGDGLLNWFIIGLSAFLIGHLFYIGGFLTRWSFSWFRFFFIMPIALYSAIIGYIIVASLRFNELESLITPVSFYIITISTMLWSALMTGNKWAIMGSTLFIISDSVLAYNKFVSEIEFSGEIIMITYYFAQFFIAKTLSPFYVVKRRKYTTLI